MRPISKVAPDWWDYTTLDPHLLADAAKLSAADLVQLSRPGFEVTIYDTIEEFYCAEALEYIRAWQQATPDNPVGSFGPGGKGSVSSLPAPLASFNRISWPPPELYASCLPSGDHTAGPA